MNQDMNGFSTTLLYVKNNDLLSLLDQHCLAPSWPKSCGYDLKLFEYESILSNTSVKVEKQEDNENFIKFNDTEAFKFVLKTICEDLIKLKDYLNQVTTKIITFLCMNLKI
jgi:hypothetical protein